MSLSFLVASSPIVRVMSLLMCVAAVFNNCPSRSRKSCDGPFLFRRFHLAVLTSFFESPRRPHSTPISHNWKLPCTTSTHAAAHGMQRVTRRHRYSHVRMYHTNRAKGGQSIAMPWPIPYSSSSSDDTSLASSWIACRTLASDIAFPFGLHFFSSRQSHVLGW